MEIANDHTPEPTDRSTRVLVIAPNPFFVDRGTPIRIYEEVKGLSTLGYDCTIATYHLGEVPADIVELVKVHRIRNIAPWYKKTSAGASLTKILFDLQLLFLVRRLLKKESFELIHAHNYEGVGIAWVAKFLAGKKALSTGAPLIADLHGSLSEELLPSWTPAYIRRLVDAFALWAEHVPRFVITSSEENTTRVARRRDTTTTATVLDGALNPSVFQGLDRAALRTELKIPDDAFIVLYAGGFGKEKGSSTLSHILSSLFYIDDRIHCVIAGNLSINMQAKLQQIARSERLHIISPLSYAALPRLLRASDLALDVKPATSHQASGKLLNAMAAGLPTLAFDRDYTAALLTPDQRIAPTADVDGFLQTINYFFVHQDLAKQRGAENASHAALYSWGAASLRIDSIYQALLES